jgi:hypothetical protein
VGWPCRCLYACGTTCLSHHMRLRLGNFRRAEMITSYIHPTIASLPNEFQCLLHSPNAPDAFPNALPASNVKHIDKPAPLTQFILDSSFGKINNSYERPILKSSCLSPKHQSLSISNATLTTLGQNMDTDGPLDIDGGTFHE